MVSRLKAISMALAMLIHSFLNGLDPWVMPSSQLRYDQAAFLTAHNAYASYNDGWKIYCQQTWTIKEQLDNGVRGLMLDTHHHKGSLVFCHRTCTGIHGIMRGGSKGAHQKLCDTISLLTEWLYNNPSEIVTLFFETWTECDKLHHSLQTHADFAALVLTDQDWNFDQHNGRWPTLAWMQKYNKRVVIFVEDQTQTKSKPSCLLKPLWHHVIEANPFSRWSIVKKTPSLYKERPQSAHHKDKKRSLFMLDFYGTITSLSNKKNEILNSYKTLNEVIHLCGNAQIAKGQKPNFISLDFVDKGNAMKVINELNKKAAESINFTNQGIS